MEDNNVKGEENQDNQKGKEQETEEEPNKFKKKNITFSPLPFLRCS